MKRLFKFRYPKLFALIAFIILAYFIFSNPTVKDFVLNLEDWNSFGAFIAGIFFAFGFTSPFSAGFFITLNPENILLIGLAAGIGAMLGDLFIFHLIRFSFRDEFERLENTHPAKKLSKEIDLVFGHKIKIYLIYALAGFFIASPLPDEAGIIMLAGLTKIKPSILAISSLILHTAGILILLGI